MQRNSEKNNPELFLKFLLHMAFLSNCLEPAMSLGYLVSLCAFLLGFSEQRTCIVHKRVWLISCCIKELSQLWQVLVRKLDNLYLDRSLSILVMAPSHCCNVKQTYLPSIHRYLYLLCNKASVCVCVKDSERQRKS